MQRSIVGSDHDSRFGRRSLLAVGLSAQDKKTAPKAEHYDFHPLMQKIWDDWGTLNPANTAKYYSKDAKRTFFDIAPMKYNGWSEYGLG